VIAGGGFVSKLANPNNLIVKRALRTTCPTCNSGPGDRCVTNNQLSKGRHFSRVVHYARCEFRPGW
jgi:hypothetical protein